MGEAMAYTLSNWAALTRYAADGDLPIDNNAVERMLKIIGLGAQKLDVRRQRAWRANRGGVVHDHLQPVNRDRLNTWAYLRDVLWRLADLKPGELEQLLPDRWRDSRVPAA